MATAADVRAGAAYIELRVRNLVSAGLRNASADMSRFLQSMQRAGFGAMLGGGFLATPMLAAANSAAELEKAIALIQVTTDDATGSMDALRASVQKTARELPFTEAEVARAGLELARAGLGRSDIASSLPGVAQFAMISDTGLAESATTLSRIAKAMEIDLSDLGRVANVMAFTANSTATNMTEMGVAMSYVAGQARASNLSLEETASLLQMITEGSGIVASRAGAGLRNAMQLTVTKSDKISEAFGFDVIDRDTSKIMKFTDVIENLRAARARMGNDAFQAAAMPIFTTRNFQIVEALVREYDRMAPFQRKLAENTNYLQDSTDDLNTTFGFMWERIKSIIDTVQNQLGRVVGGTFTDAMSIIEGAAETVGDFIRNNESLIQSVTRTAIGFVAVGSAVWLTGTFLQVLWFGVAPLAMLLGLVVKLTAGFLTMAVMNPFGLAIVGAVALVAYMSDAQGQMESIEAYTLKSADRMGQAWVNVGEEIRRAFEIGNSEGILIGARGAAGIVKDEVGGGIQEAWDEFAIKSAENLAPWLMWLGPNPGPNSDLIQMVAQARRNFEYEKAARENERFAEAKNIEAKIRESNNLRAAELEAAKLAEQKAQRMAELQERAAQIEQSIAKSLGGFLTSGGFSGFTARIQSLFVQGRSVDEQQLDELRSIKDEIGELVANTDTLRGLDGAVFMTG